MELAENFVTYSSRSFRGSNSFFQRTTNGKVLGAMQPCFRASFRYVSLALVLPPRLRRRPSLKTPVQDQDQSVLTLADALKLAKDRNGTVRSADMSVKAGDASVVEALAAFYPTINTQYEYNSDREAIHHEQHEHRVFPDGRRANILEFELDPSRFW